MAAGDATVFLVTPNLDDGELALDFLDRHGIPARRGGDLRTLAAVLEAEGVGCAVLVEEALHEDELALLRETLERLPRWRDLPLVVVTRQPAAMGERLAEALPASTSVTLLERPLDPASLVSAAQAGLRATRRQLEVAALIDERERAVRARDEFLAMLAHELRNPLAPMLNAVHLQKEMPSDDPLFHKTRDILERQVTHIARMVEDLVDVARLEKGKMALQKARVGLNPLVASAVEAALPMVQARGHQVKIDLGEPLTIEADPTRIEQIVCNLLTNAAKFTPQADVIRVATRRDGATAVVEVQDHGSGFAAGDADKLFGLFVQGSQSLARPQGGLGVGLTIARRLAEMHKGSIQAKSDGPGRGALFSVRLPLVAGGVARDEPGREHANGARKRVLVVDDSADIRETMRLLLTAWGHDVAVASSGEDGLEQVRRGRPDIAIIDIGLPGISGYEMARRIRAMRPVNGIRLIALTGYGQPDDGRRALQSGFDTHLLKPLAPEVLRETLAF